MYSRFDLKRVVIITILLLITTKNAAAAGPITHAYLADRWIQYREQYNQQGTESFIKGTLFPDIRYLGVISRKETHEPNMTLKNLIKEKSPFIKGKKLHAFVDEEREKMVIQWKIYDKLKHVPGQMYMNTFLKLVEDEILFEKNKWSKIKESLKTLDANERLYKVSDENLIKWHEVLSKCFTVSPTEHLKKLSKQDKYFFNVPPKVVRRWSVILPTLSKDPEMQAYVTDLMIHFDNIFKK
jgi:hypothetical protein